MDRRRLRLWHLALLMAGALALAATCFSRAQDCFPLRSVEVDSAATEPAAEPAVETARVFFVRSSTSGGPRPVRVDDRELGRLPKHSYLSAELPPGAHLVWAGKPALAFWFEFEAGRVYCFTLVYGGGTKDGEARWLLDDASIVEKAPGFLAHLGLEEVEAETHLRPWEEIPRVESRDFERASRKADPVMSLSLPIEVEGVFHVEQLLRFKDLVNPFRSYKGGPLRIDELGLHFELRKKNISIPLESILTVSLGGFQPTNPSPWMVVIHGSLERPVTDFFSLGHNYNRVFAALSEAVRQES